MELVAAGYCEGQKSEWKFKNLWALYQSVAAENLDLEAPFSFRSPQLPATAEDGFWESLGRGHGGLCGLHHPSPPYHPLSSTIPHRVAHMLIAARHVLLRGSLEQQKSVLKFSCNRSFV